MKLNGGPRKGTSLGELISGDAHFVEEWWHLGHQVWSPYAPWRMRVQVVDDALELPPDPRRVYVESKLEYKSVRKLFAPLYSYGKLYAKLFYIEERGRHIPSIQLKGLPFLSRDDEDLERFWPTRERRACEGGGADEGGEGAEDPEEDDVADL